MIKRPTGYRAHGAPSVVRGTRISLELDSRLEQVAARLGISKSQTIAECVLAYVLQLEIEHGIASPLDEDCSGIVGDTIAEPIDKSKAEDNNEE
jgi:predicted transcriptional regulator|tara:strand:+ start:182 stop:463 length:282 start_codon:yes stop_codon:yes gene_type:complete